MYFFKSLKLYAYVFILLWSTNNHDSTFYTWVMWIFWNIILAILLCTTFLVDFFSPKTFFMAAPQRKSARELLECTIDCRGKWSVITIDVSFKKTSFLSSPSILVTIIYVGTPPNFRACAGWKLYPRRLKSTFFKKILFVLRSPALRHHPL